MEKVFQWIADIIPKLWSDFCGFISSEPTSTIIAGVIVFVACEWIKEVWLSPLQEYKKIKGKIAHALVLYAHFYSNPLTFDKKNDDYDKASDSMRSLAADISEFVEIIPMIHPGIPRAKTISEVSRSLIGISNSFYISRQESLSSNIKDNDKRQKAIREKMKLRGISD